MLAKRFIILYTDPVARLEVGQTYIITIIIITLNNNPTITAVLIYVHLLFHPSIQHLAECLDIAATF